MAYITNILLKYFPLSRQVVGKGVLDSVGVVISINEQEGIATVKFPSCDYRRTSKASDILTVPISRLCTPRSEVITSHISVKLHNCNFVVI